MDLPQKADDEELKLYVLGLARDERTEKKQWLLSARWAQNVADFLSDILPSELPYSVYSWGSGPGTLWIGEKNLDTSGIRRDEQLQILIAVLRAND